MEDHRLPGGERRCLARQSSATGGITCTSALIGAAAGGAIAGELSVAAETSGSSGTNLSAINVPASSLEDNRAGAGAVSAAESESSEGTVALAMSPKWSDVLKRGRRKRAEGRLLVNQHAGNAARKRTKPIVGTGAQSNIKVVQTKLVSVFATKFSPDLDAGTLANYLKGKLGRDILCERIDSVNTRYSSFKVCVECNDVAEMYTPELWPEGSVVRRYYEPRNVKGAKATAVSDTTAPSGAVSLLP